MKKDKKNFEFSTFLVALLMVVAICILGIGVAFGIKQIDNQNLDNVAYADYQALEPTSVIDFNQLWNFSSISVSSFQGYTFDKSSNIIKVSGASTVSSGYSSVSIPFSLTRNHKYYYNVDFVNTNHVVRIGLTDWTNTIGGSYISSDTSVIFNYNFSNGSGSYRLVLNYGLDVVADFSFKIQLIDLTQIYGSGYEPSSVEQFKLDFPSDYYNYTLSSMISLSGITQYQNGYNNAQSYYQNQLSQLNTTIGSLSDSISFNYFGPINSIKAMTGYTYSSDEDPNGGYNYNYLYSNLNDVSIYFDYLFGCELEGVLKINAKKLKFYEAGLEPQDPMVETTFDIQGITSSGYYPTLASDISDYNLPYVSLVLSSPVGLHYDYVGLRFIIHSPIVNGEFIYNNVNLYHCSYSLQDVYNNYFEEGAKSVDTVKIDQLGYNRGYEQGYSKGSSDNNNYFLMAATAPIDATLNMFDGMFNWELFGVNLKTFLLSLFSIAIVITIIKFALGGK